MSRKPEKPLTDEDRVLWNLVARSTTPLKGRKHAATAEEPVMSWRRRSPQTMPEPPKPIAPAPRRATTAQTTIDRPTHDKLAGGRLPIEGRVDLHGMTQEQAYSLLLSFLGRAHANGIRYVLVITGKGSSSGGDGVLTSGRARLAGDRAVPRPGHAATTTPPATMAAPARFMCGLRRKAPRA